MDRSFVVLFAVVVLVAAGLGAFMLVSNRQAEQDQLSGCAVQQHRVETLAEQGIRVQPPPGCE